MSSISSKEIANVPVSNVSEAMTGKLAGVNITTTEGSPDAEVKIRVRGGGSLSQDNSPLYIVDGFPVSSISDIAPSEIATIDVLKDASSTAIYGARGANGVIIITTKSGSEGKTQVNFNASYGWKKNAKEIEVLNPYEFVLYQYETASASNNPSNLGGSNYGNYADYDIWKSRAGHNFQDEVFGRTGTQAIYNANVSGGSKDFKYNVSYAHNQENSIMEKSGYNKDNIGAKLQAKLNKWLTFDFNARMAYQKIKGLSGGADTNDSNAANSTVAQTITFAPIQELVSADEDEENSSSSRRSPMERLDGTYKLQTRFQQNYNAALTWKPFKHWTAKTEFGYGWKYYDTDQAWTALAVNNSKFGHNGRPQAQFVRDTYKSWRNANTLTYDNNKLFGGRDHLNVLIGHEWSSDMQTTRTSTSVDFPVDFSIDQILSFTNTAESTLGNEVDIKAKDNMLSFFGRINYTLLDRYMLTATFRADGSSRFAKGHKWGYFPSAALAWKINNEEFLKDTKWLDELKLRLGWGITGQQDITGDFLYAPLFTLSDSYAQVQFGNQFYTTLRPSKYNPNLKWEQTTTYNAGVDFSALNGRISWSLDGYYRKTKDLINSVSIPVGTNFGDVLTMNIGSMKNYGIEFAINAKPIVTKDFTWDISYNISWNHNEITSLKGSADGDKDYYVYTGDEISRGSGTKILANRVGESANSFFVYQQVYDKDGKPIEGMYVDRNGDGKINASDRYFYKSPAAPVNMGLTTKFLYKNWDLSAAFHASIGNYVYYDYLSNNGSISASGIFANSAFRNTFQEAVDLGFTGIGSEYWLSDYFVRNASYLKCSNITLGYTFPALLKLAGQDKLSGRVFFTVQNPFFITKYKGLDPEVKSGIDKNPYPRPRSFQLGLTLNF